MRTLHKTAGACWVAALLACSGTPAMAFAITPTNDAFDLGAALSPTASGLASVTGVSVDLGSVSAQPGQAGTFTGGLPSIGFDSGIVLSTGNVGEIFAGAAGTSGQNFGRTPGPDTASLLAQVPGGGSGFFDAFRFTVEIDPGFTANFVNFELAYGTNEIDETTDRVGIFLNGVYYGLLSGQPIDQFHPWAAPAGSQFGFGTNVYPNGSTVDYPSVSVSLPVLGPAHLFTLDIIVADVTDGKVDSALFLGNLGGSETALGNVLAPIPEPGTYALVVAGMLALGVAARRRAR